MSPAYNAAYPAGTRVRIRDLASLERFRQSWKFHDPLQPSMLEFAGRVAVVEKVGFYHGGDPLYVLDGAPGVWHEACLEGEEK